MKNFIFLVVMLVTVKGYSQTCTISGQVKDTSVRITLLYADQLYKTYELNLPVNDQGQFNLIISLPYPVFALLQSGTLKRRLLLSPGRHLQLNIDGTYAGKAAIENELVHKGILDNSPVFTKEWTDSFMSPIDKAIAEQTAAIEAANLPASLKKILSSETKYAYQCYLNDFTRDDLRRAKNPYADSLSTCVIQWLPLPDSLTLVSGYYANMMLQRHGRHAVQTVAKDRATLKASISSYLGMPFDEIDRLMNIYGQTAIMGLLYARHHLPAAIRDKMIYNSIIEAADAHELSTARFLYNHMQKDFPGSYYLTAAKAAIHHLEIAIESHAGNTGIRFNKAAGIGSLQELVKPYAGKIVYLDIWGTWCGPCREQMRYANELKKRYAGKDIVFVYLDKDNNDREGIWKEYVHVAGLEGEHYRMTQTEIEAIWKSIKEAGNENIHTYPTYVIIDRQGAIVHSNAERPGSREKLYAQLDKML